MLWTMCVCERRKTRQIPVVILATLMKPRPLGQVGLSTFAYCHLWISSVIQLITQTTKEL